MQYFVSLALQSSRWLIALITFVDRYSEWHVAVLCQNIISELSSSDLYKRKKGGICLKLPLSRSTPCKL